MFYTNLVLKHGYLKESFFLDGGCHAPGVLMSGYTSKGNQMQKDEKEKIVKTYVKTDHGLWERFKKFAKENGMTLEHCHKSALKKMMGEG